MLKSYLIMNYINVKFSEQTLNTTTEKVKSVLFSVSIQHVLVLSSLCALVVDTLIQEVDKDRVVAYVLFCSGISTLLQSWIGSR